jgi:tRNA 2-thiocytidine biosynthesis protein TtcA
MTVIRPFYLVDEDRIQRYWQSMGWPKVDLGCPTAGSSKREEIRHLLKHLYKSNKKVKGNVFHALHNVKAEYLL